MRNICDFGFTPEEEVTVLRGAEIFKATVQGRPPIDIENAFDLAKALRVLKEHNYGSGGQGTYKRALVQYGFVNRHGEAISPSIRSNLENLLKNEAAARKWWDTKVPDHERYGWTSPVTIAKAWVKSTKPEIEKEDEADGPGAVNRPERNSPQDDPASWVGAQAATERLVEFAGFCEDDDQKAVIGERLTAAGYFAQPESFAEPPSKPDVMHMVADLIAESRCYARGAHVLNRPQDLTKFTVKEAEELAAWLSDFAKAFRKVSREQPKPAAATDSPAPGAPKKRGRSAGAKTKPKPGAS